MSAVISATGGAKVGWVSATWPLARLRASAQTLSLGGLLLGTYTFTPDQVASLEPCRSLLGSGIRIVHTNPSYPEEIVFWSFSRRLIHQVQAVGFRPRAKLTSVPERNGIPMRWSFIIAWLVLWNALILVDQSVLGKASRGFGVFSLLAMAMLFLTSVGVSRSSQFQSLALKPGRSASEIRPLLLLLQFIGAVGLVVMLAQYVAS